MEFENHMGSWPMDHTQPLCRRIMYGMVGQLVQIHRSNVAVDIGNLLAQQRNNHQ